MEYSSSEITTCRFLVEEFSTDAAVRLSPQNLMTLKIKDKSPILESGASAARGELSSLREEVFISLTRSGSGPVG